MTRDELLQRISIEEIKEWMAYYRLEPWGEIQQEFRAALVASIIANTARDEKKHKEPFKAEEFMRETYLDKVETQETDLDQALFNKAKMIFGALSAKKKE